MADSSPLLGWRLGQAHSQPHPSPPAGYPHLRIATTIFDLLLVMLPVAVIKVLKFHP